MVKSYYLLSPSSKPVRKPEAKGTAAERGQSAADVGVAAVTAPVVSQQRKASIGHKKPAASGSKAGFNVVIVDGAVHNLKGSKSKGRAFKTSDFMNFTKVYGAEPMDRVEMIRQGVPAQVVADLASHMGLAKNQLMVLLDLARATTDRKAKEGKPLAKEETARVIGMARLIGQVQSMVEQSGNPKGFNAAGWLANWIEQPVPALGGQKPSELLDTQEGQGIVSGLLARMQSGAYA